ncbi:MAG: hydrogenase iron-sulfur subunit [Desulfobacterales bacterium]|nr:hydrogenase iron-sulfur subunit [Desulfobacterales bacterium]|tara:strand:- start:3049 stop:3483 length:435 start_codon:yes stop_codon:yes gene_type:complete
MKSPDTNFKPEIVILFCRHCVGKDVTFTDSSRRFSDHTARWVIMPCSSKAEIDHLVKLFKHGPDAVQVVGCPEHQCRFLNGNIVAEKRVKQVSKLLDEIGFGSERIKMINGDGLTREDLLNMAKANAEDVRPLGPNPMKKKNRR